MKQTTGVNQPTNIGGARARKFLQMDRSSASFKCPSTHSDRVSKTAKHAFLDKKKPLSTTVNKPVDKS
jgi:hypothetical protein